jgi:hypothetical protein
MDGYLDCDEFKAAGVPDSDNLFDELNTNKDNKISKDEFIKGAESYSLSTCNSQF